MPPGNYELHIHVTKPKPGNRSAWSPFPNPDDELGLLVRDVVVPPGDGPFDLGKLTVKIKGYRRAGEAGGVGISRRASAWTAMRSVWRNTAANCWS